MEAALPLADRIQALADPTRLRILALLRIMELSVGELAQILGQSQPRVSRHLKILADAGVLERRKEGSWVFLTLSDVDRVAPMYALPLADHSADTIVIHQVLHYAHSPAAAIGEAARVLAPGGTLLVVDFAAHEREELRSSDAQIRLGFEDEVMAGWFAAAGLEVDHVEHLKGGELTVTLWRGVKTAEQQRRAA
jgi:DNA-binding transcriptional ArsR family regulator